MTKDAFDRRAFLKSAVAGSAGVAAVFWILAGVIGLGSVIGRRAHASSPVEAPKAADEPASPAA